MPALPATLVAAAAAAAAAGGGGGCGASDQELLTRRAKVCRSFSQQDDCCGAPCGDVSADGDWPNQAVYMHDVLTALASPTTCLNTSYAQSTVAWLNSSQADPASNGFINTWDVFQVQYYDTPRLPGTRIESPDTLGRKCWAFAYLRQVWDPAPLKAALAAAGLDASAFVTAYDGSIPLTMGLCEKVMANCFVNATYDPQRNGTCSGKIFEFHVLGFDRENIKRSSIVKYPFY